jgi:nicotinamide-nucleotide amidase
MIPAGATILENRHGSAPGIWLEDEKGRWVAMLPGVPREFRGMLRDELLPRIIRRLDSAGASPRTVVRSRTLRTTGIAESALADTLDERAKDPAGLGLAYLPGWEGVDLRLSVWDLPEAEAVARIASAESVLREKVGRWIYGVDDSDLAELVLAELRARGMRIAVGESCTGGMLGMRLTSIPGSSDVVEGGTIAYANAVKVRELGVKDATIASYGAVSEEVAREMATGARERFGVDVGVGITGIAGPGGGTPEKPVGTFCVAVDLRGAVSSLKTGSVGDRHEVRQRSTQAALNLVRRALGALSHAETPNQTRRREP